MEYLSKYASLMEKISWYYAIANNGANIGTSTSSAVAVACMALQVLGVWWGTRLDFKAPSGKSSDIIGLENEKLD